MNRMAISMYTMLLKTKGRMRSCLVPNFQGGNQANLPEHQYIQGRQNKCNSKDKRDKGEEVFRPDEQHSGHPPA